MHELAPEAVAPLLRGAFGHPYRFVETCASTQDLLRDASLPEGAVAVADHQTAGRGRSGRAWLDAPGEALLCSVLLRPPTTPDRSQLSLVAGLAAAEAIEEASGRAAAVKWPNDVVLEGHKLAGILLEVAGDDVICGIGVNVRQPPGRLPAGRRPPAGSLRSVTGRDHDRGRLLASLLAALEAAYGTWTTDGLVGLLPRLERRNWLRGRPVVAADAPGRADAIAADGRLAVVRGDGERALVSSGEVVLAEDAV